MAIGAVEGGGREGKKGREGSKEGRGVIRLAACTLCVALYVCTCVACPILARGTVLNEASNGRKMEGGKERRMG